MIEIKIRLLIDTNRGIYFSESRFRVGLVVLGGVVESVVGWELLRDAIVVGFVHEMLKYDKTKLLNE